MRQPEFESINARLERCLSLPTTVMNQAALTFGRVIEVGPTILRANMPDVGLGELCCLERQQLLAEVVGIDGHTALLSPFAEPLGVCHGDLVKPLGYRHKIALGDFLIGKVVDGLGRSLDGDFPQDSEYRNLDSDAPHPLTRRLIDTPLPLGVRAIDGLLTCGRGQRLGIFSAAGVGKSSLLGMICDGSLADVIVLALVGERGREVREFLEHTLSDEARKRTVVVVATSDRPALERLKAAYTATTIAEYFRDQGKNVLLMMDSLTRFARAAREIGLAAGEKPVAGGYPPSFFAQLPRLLERTGCSANGCITGIYTVLVDGGNMLGPVADEVRSILDGHIVLSPKLAAANHYPAIDIGASVSRVMQQIVTPQQSDHAGKMRRLMARYQEIELLVRIGEYQQGKDAEADEALHRRIAFQTFLQQRRGERTPFDEMLSLLRQSTEDA